MTYPANHTDQQVVWGDLQEQLAAQIDLAEPFIVTQATEPTQNEWEAAWTDAGNTLPITPGKRLLWFDGNYLRGEYAVLDNDFYTMISPVNVPNYLRDVRWRSDGSIIGLVKAKPSMAASDSATTSAIGRPPAVKTAETVFTGIARLSQDGLIDEELWEPLARRWWDGDKPRLEWNSFYYRADDTAYLMEALPMPDATSCYILRLRPTSAGAYLRSKVANYVGPATNPDTPITFYIFLGSTASVDVDVTVEIMQSSGSTVYTSNTFTVPANAPMMRYSFTDPSPDESFGPTEIRLTFDTSLPDNEYIYVGSFFLHNDTAETTKFSNWLGWSNHLFEMSAYSSWTLSDLGIFNNGDWNAALVAGVNIISKNLTTNEETNVIICKGDAGSWTGLLQNRKIKLLYVDANDCFYLAVPSFSDFSDRFVKIYRYNAATQALDAVYTAATDADRPTRILVDEVNEKFILGFGNEQPAKIMNTDGTDLTVMTDLYTPTMVYNGKVYGRSLTSVWPNNLRNRIKMWDAAAEELVEYESPYPNFDLVREEFVAEAALFETTRQQPGTVLIPQAAINPLIDVLPVFLEQEPNGDRLLAVYGYDINPDLRRGVAALIADTGSTGKVRRIMEWTSPHPDYWTLHDFTLDVDYDELNFDLSGFDLRGHEVLVLGLSNNCISANDTLVIQFNGDTGSNYWSTRVSASAATVSRAESASVSGIQLPAPNSTVPSMYTVFLPGFQDSNSAKTGVVIGGQHLAVTTGNLQPILANIGWSGNTPITSIRITTVTAGRKLRSGGRISIAVMKTRERFNNDDFFNPTLA